MIPKYDPTYSLADLAAAWRKRSSGTAGEELCARLKELHAVKHVFLFDNARNALFAILKAHGRPGGVLMPAYTCIVVPEAVTCAGYQPAFVDIDPNGLNVTREAFAKALTPETSVILATHLFGIPCDVDAVVQLGREHGLLVIEDAAPALGAEYAGKRVGDFGDASIISFQAVKVISGEDGGALLTNNDQLAEKVSQLIAKAGPASNCRFLYARAVIRKLLLHHSIYPLTQFAYRLCGKEKMYELVTPKCEEPDKYLKQCSPFSMALALVQMDRLPGNLERRRQLARIYADNLADLPHVKVPLYSAVDAPAWIQYPILVQNKSDFFYYMQRHGIDVSWTYRYSCADSYGMDGFPEAKKAAMSVMGLPTYPSLSDKDARYVCEVTRKYKPSN
jgi:perosamine synthetase